MGKILTAEEWKEIRPPICWKKISRDFNWGEAELDLALKWAGANCEGWVYRLDRTFIFGDKSDATVFELWIREDILEDDTGMI